MGYFDLRPDAESHDQIHENIVKGIMFKGTNLWILVFAIVVASVGLNMNSTAVIIGAMLISPLMGPINGMGYSIATYDFPLFRRAAKHFSFAVVTSLIASTTYFAISPISTAHSELLARTSPNIYDVLIALFGGLAGMVGIASKNKGNVLPGVAIATALMPPLCTAGFGLAAGKWDFFGGAIYLFTINTVFIALASLVISQLLRFPTRTIVDPAQKKRVNRGITAVILVVLLPSLYFGYTLVLKEKFIENAKNYVADVSSFEGNYLLQHEIEADKKEILLVYGGADLSEPQEAIIKGKAEFFNLKNAKIDIKQGLSILSSDGRNAESVKLKEELIMVNGKLREQERSLDSLAHKTLIGKDLLLEIHALYPAIIACEWASGTTYRIDSTRHPSAKPVLILYTKGQSLLPEQQAQIEKWLIARLRTPETKLYFEPADSVVQGKP